MVRLVSRALLGGLAVLLISGCGPAKTPQEPAHEIPPPWFAQSVGNASQVVSVVGTGGATAQMELWQLIDGQWQSIERNLPADIGSAGFADSASDDNPATPRGVFSLDYAFGTLPSPPTGLRYVRVDSNDWWDVDSKSPTYNTLQHCVPSKCRFDTTVSENLADYPRAIVMGVNQSRVPQGGSAFFVHGSDGGPSAGCVTVRDNVLVRLIEWLRPGAVIAIRG